MSILDIFRIKQIKESNTALSADVERLTNQLNEAYQTMPSESRDILSIRTELNQLASVKQMLLQEINQTRVTKQNLLGELTNIQKEINSRKKLLTDINESIVMEEFGIYTPRYPCMSSESMKKQIDYVRERQKSLVKSGTAILGREDWSVNNSVSEGRKMINDIKKLILRAFNSEADEAISKVKYNNVEKSEKRIRKSAELISKLGRVFNMRITPAYVDLKIEELYYAYEYQLKKQEEKEEQQELHRRMKEEEQLRKEIERERIKKDKERVHYLNRKADIESKILKTKNAEGLLLLQKELQEIYDSILEINQSIEDLNEREANQRVGYVYIISNVGSFGENIYKIGMTRRLEPQERVNELSGASVPFKFDVHAMIFTEDAPSLEKALHKHFSDRRVNLVNMRKEFFRVSLKEIEEYVQSNFDATVEFTKIADAPEYRLTEQMRKTNYN